MGAGGKALGRVQTQRLVRVCDSAVPYWLKVKAVFHTVPMESSFHKSLKKTAEESRNTRASRHILLLSYAPIVRGIKRGEAEIILGRSISWGVSSSRQRGFPP